jgi:hypothetical protein
LSAEGSADIALEDAEGDAGLFQPLGQGQPAKTGADDAGGMIEYSPVSCGILGKKLCRSEKDLE